MAENPKAFRDAMQRAERRRAVDDKLRQEEQRPSGHVRSAVEAAQAHYHGYIATINGMRDRDIERAMVGR